MSRIRSFLLTAVRRPARAAQHGLTLLEIMIVIAILGLLIAIVVPKVMGALSSSKVDLTKVAVDKLVQEAYPQWTMRNSNKGCPDTLLEVAAVIEKTQDDLIDPWGSPFKFVCAGAGLPQGISFGVYSLGEDRTENTPDDIKSWEKVVKK